MKQNDRCILYNTPLPPPFFFPFSGSNDKGLLSFFAATVEQSRTPWMSEHFISYNLIIHYSIRSQKVDSSIWHIQLSIRYMLTLVPILYTAHSVKTEGKYDLTLFFLTDQRGCWGGRQKHRCIVLVIFIMLSPELPPQVFKIDQEDLRHENVFISFVFLQYCCLNFLHIPVLNHPLIYVTTDMSLTFNCL